MTWTSRVPVTVRRLAVVAAAVPLSAGLATPAVAAPSPAPDWRLVHTAGDASLRGLDAVSRSVAWASGSEGTVLRTTDGGRTWRSVGPRGTAKLQFRDIEAFDADSAVIMAIGATPGAFRFYRTDNGGRSWSLTYRNREPQAFFDCMTFTDNRRGVALSDPVNGKFRILATDDGGRSWRVNATAGMPRALKGEFAFAASGTCIVSEGRHVWFATGGAERARVFRSDDAGRTWKVSNTPIRSGPTAGIYSLAFRDALQGVAVGGDFTKEASAPRAMALTADGGRTWTLVGDAPGEYRSGSSYKPHTRGTALVVGPTGSDITTDGGFHWRKFDSGTFHAVQCAEDGACWASGAKGRIARLVYR